MSDFDPAAGQGLATTGQPVASVPTLVDQNTYTTGFQDNSVRQYEFELYSGRTGVTDRLFLIRSGQITKTRRHYNEKVKFIICNSEYTRNGDQELMTREAECCKKLGSNNLTFAALVVRYMTEKNGNVIRPFVMPELRLWRFGVDKYIQLRGIDAEHPLNARDILITCSDEKYQKMNIGAASNCIYQMPGFPAEIKAQFEQWADTSLSKVPREMGRKMSDADILKELGVAGAAAPATMASDAPITDFSAIVGGATAQGAKQ